MPTLHGSRDLPAPGRRRASVPPIDPRLYAPTPERPLRAKYRRLAADVQVYPHAHPFAQVAMSGTGVIRMTTPTSTYLVPPSRALWIPPGVEHAVTVVEDAEIHTLYVHQDRAWAGPTPNRLDESWRECRVLEVSSLLRELVPHLDVDAGAHPDTPRQRCIATLVLDELAQARALPLGVAMPADKRLRALCEAVLEDPTRGATLEAFALHAGASSRTIARLFRTELGTSFAQWRQQVLLSQALLMASRRQSMASIAAQLGYASASAFGAMVKRSFGVPPRKLFNSSV